MNLRIFERIICLHLAFTCKKPGMIVGQEGRVKLSKQQLERIKYSVKSNNLEEARQ